MQQQLYLALVLQFLMQSNVINKRKVIAGEEHKPLRNSEANQAK